MVRPDGTDYAWDEIYNIENYTLIGDFDAQLIGDDQDNKLIADSGNDIIRGGDGDDFLDGGDGDDIIRGGDGNDFLATGDGDDQLFGEAGDDTLQISGSGAAALDGGSGNDTVLLNLTNYTASTENFTLEINLTDGVSGAVGVQGGLEDTFISIENIHYIGSFDSRPWHFRPKDNPNNNEI